MPRRWGNPELFNPPIGTMLRIPEPPRWFIKEDSPLVYESSSVKAADAFEILNAVIDRWLRKGVSHETR